jgi:hypothetical protein
MARASHRCCMPLGGIRADDRLTICTPNLGGLGDGCRRFCEANMIGWLIAAVLIWCVIRSPGTVLLLVALGAAAISRG